MKLNQKSGAKIAMTAAALVVSSVAPIGSAYAVEGIPGRCFGVNGCAGKGACKTTKNDCKGKNACKGQGWVEMLQEECKGHGGQFENS
ncbi:MAG: BufA2 family periplasmic bufferin-type metallophore [Methyloceanibacter sp.]